MMDSSMSRWFSKIFKDAGIKSIRRKSVLILLISFVAISLITSCNRKKETGYFNQAPPENNVVKFASGIVSLPDRGEYNISFSKGADKCYFDGYSGSSSGNPSKIYYAELAGNSWSEPVEIPSLKNQNFAFYGLSADDSSIYLGKDNKIWESRLTNGIWEKPELLPEPINSTFGNYGSSETGDGVIYFFSNRPEGTGKTLEVWRFLPVSGTVENLGAIINANIRNITPCIALDGSYIIYSQSDTNYEYLYISFNKGNNEWSEPINMDESGIKINIGTYQNSPSLSHDGKYLFFNSHNSDDERLSDIYWVSTEVIDSLRLKVLGK